MSDIEKTIEILPFSGHEYEWREWNKKFLAKAEISGYKGILEGTVTPPKDSDTYDRRTKNGKKKEKLRQLQKDAYGQLILSCTGIAFGFVDNATSTAHPNGDAKLAWDNLNNKYAAMTVANRIELMQFFSSSRLHFTNEDPDLWIQRIEHLRGGLKNMNHDITDDNIIAHILTNLPSEYSEIVTSLEGDINNLKYEDLKTRLRAFHR